MKKTISCFHRSREMTCVWPETETLEQQAANNEQTFLNRLYVISPASTSWKWSVSCTYLQSLEYDKWFADGAWTVVTGQDNKKDITADKQ